MAKIDVLLPLFFFLLFANPSLQAQSLAKMSDMQVDSLRDVLINASNFSEAKAYSLESFQRHKKNKDEAYLKAALACAKISINLGEFDKAKTYFEEVAAQKNTLADKYPATYAEILNIWGVFFINSNKGPEAGAKLLESKAFQEKNGLTQSINYAKTLLYLSTYSFAAGQYINMERYLLEAKALLEKTGKTNDKTYPQVLVDLGSFYRYEATYNQAEAILQQAISLIASGEGKNSLAYARALSALAGCYQMQNKYALAEESFKEALEITKEKIGETSPIYLEALNGLGLTYNRAKRLTEAEVVFLKMQELLNKNKATGTQQVLGAKWSLAYNYMLQRKYDKSESLFMEVLPMIEKSMGFEVAMRALLLKDMVHLYTDKKEFEKATATVLKAFDANSSFIDDQAKLTEEFISTLGNTKNYCNETHLRVLESLNYLLTKQFEAEQDLELLKKSKILHQAIFQFLQLLRNEAVWVEDKMSILEKNAEIVQCGIGTAIKLNKGTDIESLSSIFGIMEQNKMLLLGDLIRTRKAQNFGYLPKELAEQEEALQKESDRLRKEYRISVEKAIKDSLQAAINNFSLRQKAFQEKLEKNYPEYFRFKYAPSGINPKEVQSVLPEKAALLEYFVADTAIYCLLLTKDRFVFKSYAIPRNVLEKQVAKLRKTLSDYEYIKKEEDKAFRDYCDAAYWFYEQLLSPILADFRGVEHLIIVPDAALNNLPFESFLTTAVKQAQPYTELPYLLRKYKIGYSYSAALFVENSKSKAFNKGKMLAFAASYKDKSATSSERRSAQLRNLRAILNDLPAARKEVEGLQANYKGDFLFDANANELNFKQKAKDYGIIHLAMHGLLDTHDPILSSFAFTENGDSTEDNFLQAWEISHLKLQADLVVLSACETGYGKFQQGEGVMSLARSFMYAGAPALVVSLWEVNDASTAKIMELFYAELAKGKDKAAALQEAKLQYISSVATKHTLSQQAAHPAFWSAFVQIGDTRPIAVGNKSSSDIPWAWIGGAVVVLGGLGFMFLRRKK